MRLLKVRKCQRLSNPDSRVSCVHKLTAKALKMTKGEHGGFVFQHMGNIKKCRNASPSQAVCAADKTLAGLEEVFGRHVLDPDEKLELVHSCLNKPKESMKDCLKKKIYDEKNFFLGPQKEAFQETYSAYLNACSDRAIEKDKSKRGAKIKPEWETCAAKRGLAKLQETYSQETQNFAQQDARPSPTTATAQ